jgi:hypothetical protein
LREAGDRARESAELLRGKYGLSNPGTIDSASLYGGLLDQLGRGDDATAVRAEYGMTPKK